MRRDPRHHRVGVPVVRELHQRDGQRPAPPPRPGSVVGRDRRTERLPGPRRQQVPGRDQVDGRIGETGAAEVDDRGEAAVRDQDVARLRSPCTQTGRPVNGSPVSASFQAAVALARSRTPPRAASASRAAGSREARVRCGRRAGRPPGRSGAAPARTPPDRPRAVRRPKSRRRASGSCRPARCRPTRAGERSCPELLDQREGYGEGQPRSQQGQPAVLRRHIRRAALGTGQPYGLVGAQAVDRVRGPARADRLHGQVRPVRELGGDQAAYERRFDDHAAIEPGGSGRAQHAPPARRTAGLRTRSSRRARPAPTGPEKSVRRGAPVREDLRP